jgi:hypothetical protein
MHGHHEQEDLEIIQYLAKSNLHLTYIVDRLLKDRDKPRAFALTANYITLDPSGNLLINNSNQPQKMPQTINVLPAQNTVPAQLVPVAADNTTVEPITTLQPGSEVYTAVDQATGTTSTVATVAPVAGGAEGQFAVTRIAGQSGIVLVSYKALSADGKTTLTNVGGTPDIFNFQGQPTGVAAALTATYGSPS